MIKTADFRTPTIMEVKRNVSVENYWPIGIDIGYSSVKGFSPNAIIAFPSYAKNLGRNPELAGKFGTDEILYRDNATDEIWRVGKTAQNMLRIRDTTDSEKELYGRERYFSHVYKVILRTGLALTRMHNPVMQYNNKPIAVQSGLPPRYLKEDKGFLTDLFSERHIFSIKTANTKRFIDFDISIEKDNIDIMSQPSGTLMNVSMDDNGGTIPESKRFYTDDTLIWDGGFGTLDLIELLAGIFSSKETFPDYGMREILSRTKAQIEDKYGLVITPNAMQQYLEKGSLTITSREAGRVSSKEEKFDDLLENASLEVCKEANEKILSVFSGLFDYKHLILTGGTCTAWEQYIRETLSGLCDLEIVNGNAYCPGLNPIFCNVRGYYMYLINMLRARNKDEKRKNQKNISKSI